jgi:hypothetical protein
MVSGTIVFPDTTKRKKLAICLLKMECRGIPDAMGTGRQYAQQTLHGCQALVYSVPAPADLSTSFTFNCPVKYFSTRLTIIIRRQLAAAG